MKIEQMGVVVTPELGGQAQERAAGCKPHHALNIRVVAQERNVLPLGEYSHPRPGVSVPDGPQERRGEENVSDGAETNRQDVRSAGRVGHADKVQRQR
jgi:hypothetical protein